MVVSTETTVMLRCVTGRDFGVNDFFVGFFLFGMIFSSCNWPTFEDEEMKNEANTDELPYATVNTWLNLVGMLMMLFSFWLVACARSPACSAVLHLPVFY